MIKQIFTGKLNAVIDSNPPYPGKERHFLRAQIARISHATSISPKGLYEFDEEANLQKFADDWSIPLTDELKSLEVWAHTHPGLLLAGRITHLPDVKMSDDEKEEYLAKLLESDPILDRFRSLNEDAPIAGLETAWLSKVVGDIQPYNYKEGTITYAVNVIKSLRWPGAVTVA